MSPHARSRLIAAACGVTALGMVGAAFAAVPLYRMFCQATGFDGATRRGELLAAAPASTREVTVRFDTNVRGLPWTFKPEQKSQTVRLGAPGQAWFTVRNDGDKAITGRAIFNVTPDQAGPHFVKTQCFCFQDQTIAPGQQMRFPVIYFVEPEFATDRNTQGFSEVVLSYTFFPSTTQAPGPVAAAPSSDAPAPRL